jgi:hypothetical protein
VTINRILFKLDADADYRHQVGAWAEISGLDPVDGPEVLAEANLYGQVLRGVVDMPDLPLPNDATEAAWTSGYNWALKIIRHLVAEHLDSPAVPAGSQPTDMAAGVPSPTVDSVSGVPLSTADQTPGGVA